MTMANWDPSATSPLVISQLHESYFPPSYPSQQHPGTSTVTSRYLLRSHPHPRPGPRSQGPAVADTSHPGARTRTQDPPSPRTRTQVLSSTAGSHTRVVGHAPQLVISLSRERSVTGVPTAVTLIEPASVDGYHYQVSC